MDVVDSEGCPRVPFCDYDFVGSAVGEEGVDKPCVFLHFVADFGDVWSLVVISIEVWIWQRDIYFVWPVMTCCQSTLTRQAVQGRELQGSRVHEHEVPPTIGIYPVKAIIDTIHIIRNDRVVQTAVSQKGIGSKIVSADPHRVNSVAGCAISEQCVRVRASIDVFAVCNEGIDFVHDIGKWAIDCCKVAIDLIIVTDCSGNSVVIELCPGVV